MGGEISKQAIAMQYHKYHNVGKNREEYLRHLAQAWDWESWVKFNCPEFKKQNQAK